MADTHAPGATQRIISPANMESIKLGYRPHDEPQYRDHRVQRLMRPRP